MCLSTSSVMMASGAGRNIVPWFHRSDGAHSQIKSEMWLESQDPKFRFPDGIWDMAREPDHKHINKYWSFV